jgi:protease-4
VPARRGLWLVTLLILAAIVASAAALATMAALFGGPSLAPQSVLVIRLRAPLDEVEPGGVLSPFLPSRPTVRSLVDTMRKAAADPRIRGLVLMPQETPVLWGKTQELREALRAFRETGKPTVAFLEYGGDQEYYLATACERIFLLPTSPLDLSGLASYEVFLRGTLDKLGITPDLVQVGDYKTAVNLWTERGFTPAHREMAEALNEDTFAELVRGIASARGKTEDEIRALIDRGPFLPEDALHEGLVDDLAYEDQLDDKSPFDQPRDGELALVEFDDYARVRPPTLAARGAARIAVVYAVGTITTGVNRSTPEGAVLGSESLVQTIRNARGDESIRAIILRIDSPGGATTAADIIWRELMLTRARKPIIASFSDVAASGGYYIALPAHHIVAQPGTLTGSVGVYGGKFVFSGTLEKLGATVDGVEHGAQAGMQSPLRPYTPDERSNYERQLEAFYDHFVERVAEARHSTPERVDAIAQGRVWTGRQALALGLVDELGGMDRAILRAKQRARIPAAREVQLVVYPPQRSLSQLVAHPFDVLPLRGAEPPALERWLPAWLPPANRRAFVQASLPWRLYRPGEPLALMPLVVVR